MPAILPTEYESYDQKLSAEFQALPKTGIRTEQDETTNFTQL